METILSRSLWCFCVVRYQVPRYSGWKLPRRRRQLDALQPRSDTKYRDIADGNQGPGGAGPHHCGVRYQVPRYSGWKLVVVVYPSSFVLVVRYQVPRYSGWKLSASTQPSRASLKSDTKYRDIADGNRVHLDADGLFDNLSDTKYRDIADGNGLAPCMPAFQSSQIPSTAI